MSICGGYWRIFLCRRSMIEKTCPSDFSNVRFFHFLDIVLGINRGCLFLLSFSVLRFVIVGHSFNLKRKDISFEELNATGLYFELNERMKLQQNYSWLKTKEDTIRENYGKIVL